MTSETPEATTANSTRGDTLRRGCFIFLLSVVLVGLGVGPIAAQNNEQGDASPGRRTPPRPTLLAGERSSEITLDGRLDDAAWQDAPMVTGFVQREPIEGQRKFDIGFWLTPTVRLFPGDNR